MTILRMLCAIIDTQRQHFVLTIKGKGTTVVMRKDNTLTG
jgi:hypothetical protein